MAATDVKISQAIKGRRHERVISLWPLELGTRQFGRLYPFRLQFLQATDDPRLAIIQRVQRVSGGIVCRDVRISAYHLFSLRMAAKSLPERRLAFPRCRTSSGNDVRLES